VPDHQMGESPTLRAKAAPTKKARMARALRALAAITAVWQEPGETRSRWSGRPWQTMNT
jgi:hypothetical protein